MPVAILEIRWRQPKIGAGFLPHEANPVLSEKPLSKMPRVVVLQDQRSKYSGLLRLTGDTTCERGKSIELIAISLSSTTREEMTNWYEEKVFQRSRYGTPRTFRAIYDHNERWIGDSDDLNDADSYRVVATDDYEEYLDMPATCSEGEEIEFYNVLWILRGDENVAYRAGCGRIFKQCWEENNPRKSRVTLG
jgi:hypothetical protein